MPEEDFHLSNQVHFQAHQPSPEGLGNRPEVDPSAVGAALNRAVSSRAAQLACGKLREK